MYWAETGWMMLSTTAEYTTGDAVDATGPIGGTCVANANANTRPANNRTVRVVMSALERPAAIIGACRTKRVLLCTRRRHSVMAYRRSTLVVVFACAIATGLGARAQQRAAPLGEPPARHDGTADFNARRAAGYMDDRLEWWLKWPNAARDHDTACVSCHTAVPYALARPSLRGALAETEPSATERKLHENVLKRVRLWKDVAPFYPDQTVGLPKTSESRGTEAILNTLILATRDRQTGTLSDDTRLAFDNLWALQFRKGDLTGAWAWLNFRLEPWESTTAAYYGAALAAIAVGTAPGNYASNPEIQSQLTLLSNYLRRGAKSEHDFNRLMVLWASTTLPALLTPDQQRAIVDAALAKQQDDGGWTMSTLGSWKRSDSTRARFEERRVRDRPGSDDAAARGPLKG